MTAAMGRGDAVVVDQFEQLFVRGTADDAERLVRIIADGLTFSTTTWIAIRGAERLLRTLRRPSRPRRGWSASRRSSSAARAKLSWGPSSSARRARPTSASNRGWPRRCSPTSAYLSRARSRCSGTRCTSCGAAVAIRAVATEEYCSIGGTRGSIAVQAAAVYARQPDDARHLVDQVLLRMVAIIDDRAPTRSAVRRTTLDETFGPWCVRRHRAAGLGQARGRR